MISWFHCFSGSNQLHLQRAQLQQALLDVGGGVEFAERLLSCGSDAEILAAKGVTLRRLTGLLEAGYDPRPADDAGAGISFVADEPAGEVDGYPLVGVVNATTLDPSRCTIEGEGELQVTFRWPSDYCVWYYVIIYILVSLICSKKLYI